MDPKRLQYLRKRQFILMNVSLLFVMPVMMILKTLDTSERAFEMGSGLILILLAGSLLFGRSLMEILSPTMRELMTYERKKLGKESKKLNHFGGVFLLLAGVYSLYRGYYASGNEPMFRLEHGSNFMIIFFLMLLIITANVFLFFHNRKIDGAKEGNLKGYAYKNIAVALIAGIVLAVFIMISTIIFVIST